MPTDKNIYSVCGYIPSDEDKVVMNVHQLLKIGDDNTAKYAWATITSGSGIGFALQFDKAFYDTAESAIIGFIKVVREDYQKTDYMTFDEMIECYKEMKQKVSENLTKK